MGSLVGSQVNIPQGNQVDARQVFRAASPAVAQAESQRLIRVVNQQHIRQVYRLEYHQRNHLVIQRVLLLPHLLWNLRCNQQVNRRRYQQDNRAHNRPHCRRFNHRGSPLVHLLLNLLQAHLNYRVVGHPANLVKHQQVCQRVFPPVLLARDLQPVPVHNRPDILLVSRLDILRIFQAGSLLSIQLDSPPISPQHVHLDFLLGFQQDCQRGYPRACPPGILLVGHQRFPLVSPQKCRLVVPVVSPLGCPLGIHRDNRLDCLLGHQLGYLLLRLQIYRQDCLRAHPVDYPLLYLQVFPV